MASFLGVFLLVLRPDAEAAGNNSSAIPILGYHRFGPGVIDRMTVTVSLFESQLRYLRDHGYTVIPLKQLVRYRLTGALPPPSRSVVITADDGHRSVYTHMLSLAKRYRIPVTLFVYPSAISNTAYALTWEQLRQLKETGLFEVQSHSYWHPNFREEKRRLSSEEYEKLVDMQLRKSKEMLEKKLKIHVDMLAWPFGFFDDELIEKAIKAGYVAAFTLEGRHTTLSDNVMALPRYLMTEAHQEEAFAELFSDRPRHQKRGY
ncbi:MAG: polysaccharide deacetylase family protein [Deltaproteobacteria bacterium]|nr:polysaccharide deacetylase family protein [Deltaproteobacteria bacterium]